MLSPLDSLSFLATQHTHAIACRLLLDRDLYAPCHIRVPDVAQRLSAVYVDNQFYSFFKFVPNAQKALDVLVRLGKRDDQVALTSTKRGYVIWAYEPNASYAPPGKSPNFAIRPVFGPKPCLLITDVEAYELCSLQVPDMAQPLTAIAYRNKYYSIFKQNNEAAKLLAMAAKLSQRGDDVLIALTPPTYTLGLFEPNGRKL